jgi:hypothetical protein
LFRRGFEQHQRLPRTPVRVPRAQFLGVLLLVGLGGCTARKGETISVRSESSPSLDVSAYRTYAWLSASPVRTGQGVQSEGALSDWRIRNAVERELAAKGYQKRASGRPDFLVDYAISMREKNTQSIRDYLDYRDRGGSMDAQEAYVFGYQEGSLILEVVDGRTRQLVWRASATAVVNPGPPDRLIQDAVHGMLHRFPSAGAGAVWQDPTPAR